MSQDTDSAHGIDRNAEARGESLNFEYVTSPVLHVRLSCPACGERVRQMHSDYTKNETLAVTMLGEPLGWLVAGLGFLVGCLAESLVAVCAFWVVGALVWYDRRLKRATFICPSCKGQCSYAQGRTAAAHRAV